MFLRDMETVEVVGTITIDSETLSELEVRRVVRRLEDANLGPVFATLDGEDW